MMRFCSDCSSHTNQAKQLLLGARGPRHPWRCSMGASACIRQHDRDHEKASGKMSVAVVIFHGLESGDLQAMRFEEYRKHDAISLAGLIAKRQVSAQEVLENAIARAEQVNPAINAIVHKQYEQARKAVAAGLPEGPLKGVPYLIKDLGFFETGEPAT